MKRVMKLFLVSVLIVIMIMTSNILVTLGDDYQDALISQIKYQDASTGQYLGSPSPSL